LITADGPDPGNGTNLCKYPDMDRDPNWRFLRLELFVAALAGVPSNTLREAEMVEAISRKFPALAAKAQEAMERGARTSWLVCASPIHLYGDTNLVQYCRGRSHKS